MPHPDVHVARDGATAGTAEGSVRTITINAADRLNSLDDAMLRALAEAVAEEPGSDRVIVLRGAGRGFCAGADLGRVEDLADASAAATIDAANDLVGALTRSPLPVVAVVHGPCAGVGVSIALAADIVIASTDAFFQLAFTKVGLMPDGGASALVAASVGRARAVRMALLAERLGAQEAAASGLIARAVAPSDLAAEADAIIAALAAGAGDALARTKAAVNAATLGGLDDAFGRERAGQLVLLGAADFAEGVRAFGDRRPPRFTDPVGGRQP
ncbi:enoyl-CoA hydratase [Microbacterium testaceum]|uniref:Enoyl-CoA hydratase n=1 Tax=Microbacterium testaceum TaxID=2033 RepID=A0A147ESR5_MICTE|nr:enoyl-CoA hydratase-related protein [Microbacterium testaceum]KTR87869.1 enoyl-CoA hydratase [Microbacterium testaceum]